MPLPIKIALVPAYEPGPMLPELVEKLSLAGFQVLVVDDGSGAAFAEVFEKTRVFAEVLTHEVNKGKGSALKTGLEHIRAAYPENAVIVTVDADGQHSVEDTLRVCAKALENTSSLVLGCRGFTAGVPARSRFGNAVTRFVYRASTGVAVSDTQTGLRAFNAELIPFLLSVSGARYEYEMNVLLACPREGIPIVEVEIQTIYFDNNSGSHFSTVKDSFRIYKEIFKFAASSLAGFITDYALYSLLTVLTIGLGAISVTLSNVLARIVSASVNYFLNKKFVFKCEGRTVKTAAGYFALAAVILLLNTLLLNYLTHGADINKYLAKVLTELALFVISWALQKFIIFRKKR